MELQDLLNIESPTLDQLRQTEALLQVAIDGASKKLADLNAEERRTAVDRLRGTDTGAADREAAVSKAKAERADAAEVLSSVQSKIAAQVAYEEAEAKADAIQATWEHLARRRAAMKQIDKLCDKITSLHDEMAEAYAAALATTPINFPRTWLTPGHNDIPKAIVTALNYRLGLPFPVVGSDALVKTLRVDGMANYLNATEDMLMGAPILNRDG